MRAALSVLLLALSVFAEEARWIRYAAISPDGSRICFSYRGDLWVVPSDGGEARPLTSHVAWEGEPVWSPDGRWLAFASDRHGNPDVFLMAAEGGPARRLTYHSGWDVPYAFEGGRVLFAAARVDAAEAVLPSTWLPELYSVSTDGGQPRRELTTPALSVRPSPDGKRLLYEDVKGFENRWRKHHVSSVARDIWILDRASGEHRKLTAFRGEDRDPHWAPDGKTVYYLSEASGSFNVWSTDAAGGEPQPVTRHGPHPVRFLSVSRDGLLAYTCNGELWTVRPGAEPRRLRVTVAADDRVNAVRRETFRKGATEFALSPEEDQVAFVVRGEVFVASVEHGTTRRVTETPVQERSVAWAPDGRTLFFAGERDGSWNLYRVSLAHEAETRFFDATLLKEEALLAGPDELLQPVPSPDGKRLAFLFNRDEIRVLDLATGTTKTVVPAARNYSYSDGDIRYAWSPDARWLACTYVPQGGWIENIAVVEVDTGRITDMTESGYFEWNPQWSADGSAILFLSNRFGRRSHGSWGSDADVFALDLTRKAHDKARLSEEEFALLKKKEKKGGGGDDGKEEKKETEKKPPEPVEVEAEGREDRVRRLTLHSAPLGDYALSPDGEKIVYWAGVEGKWDLWINEIRKSSTRRLAKVGADEGGDVRFAKDGEAVFLRKGDGGLAKVTLAGGEMKEIPYAAEMGVDAPRERAYIFEHAWRQLARKFYREDLHGVDWEALKANYAAFLPHVANNHDFAEVLSEMLGELNASHTGAGYRAPREGADETASLGLLFRGDGFAVAEVLRGGPADKAGSRIAPGAVLTHVDGTALGANVNLSALLNAKEGKPTRLTFAQGGETFDEVIKPVGLGEERELLYKRWVRGRREAVERLSGGRLGYVHVRGMNDESFRHVFQEVLGRHGAKKGLVVDTRFNGGGNLHDDLVKFLGGRRYLTFHPRGKERGAVGEEPWSRWHRPVVVVQNEGNYSDAHIFPYAFRALGIGKLVGAPVPGTGTAVWWERQIDPTLVFGIPQVGFVTPEGEYLENLELQPDVLVLTDPAAAARGEDPQLAKAVEVLLEEAAVPGK